LAATGAGTEMYFFQEYLSPTVMLASVMVFLLLLRLQPPSTQKEAHYSKLSKLVKLISQNTLAIYFVHIIVLESFQKGYFGFAINRTTVNPAVEIPVITVLVLFVSLAVVVLLKKIPYMNKLVG
jgi:surface polysaccharide O-acyltransferase-like enzyme